MNKKFLWYLCWTISIHAIKKPDVFFLIEKQSFANLAMIEIDRTTWYLKSIQLQESYLKKTICKQLHSWSDQILDWHLPIIKQELSAIENLHYQASNSLVFFDTILQELQARATCKLINTQDYNNYIFNDLKCLATISSIFMPTTILKQSTTQQAHALCAMISDFFDQDTIFTIAVVKHINLLKNYLTSPCSLDQYPALIPEHILISEINAAELLLRNFWIPFAKNKSLLKGLFLLQSTSWYQTAIKTDQQLQLFLSDVNNQESITNNFWCIDFLTGIANDANGNA